MNNKIKETIEIVDDLNKMKKNNIFNPMEELKNNLANYITSLMQSAIEEDELLSETKKHLLDKIPELEFKDLKSLYDTLTDKQAIKNNQLTSLLKPSQQSNSPLLEAFSEVKKSNKDIYETTSENMSGDDLRKLDNFSRVFDVVNKIYDKMNKDETN